MQSKLVWMTLVLVTVTSRYTTHCVILRPDWFPYFKDDGLNTRSRNERNKALDIPCPSDMTEYECYHTFMAVWSRYLQRDKRAATHFPDPLLHVSE